MNHRTTLLLVLLGISSALLVSIFQSSPGYMDADYYFASALRLYEGYGFSEQILWNFLDSPTGLPHPSHAYWLPLTSILAYMGMMLGQSDSFISARLFFIVIGGLVPILTAQLTMSLSKRRDHAILSGILAAVPGFYLAYIGTIDAFGIFMVLGALWLIVVGNSNIRGIPTQVFLLGVISGFMHLTRSDGVLWLIVALVSINTKVFGVGNNDSRGQKLSIMRQIFYSLVCILGYILVFGPWMLRNYLVFDTLLIPGGEKILWLIRYDDLYSYPASLLTPERWLESGVTEILQARIQAFGQNIQTALFVQGEIFLLPLSVLGLWGFRNRVIVRLGLLGWTITFLTMTLIFPYVGWRGAFFHSGVAVQPLIWASVPAGLDIFVQWGVRVRNWNATQAKSVFSFGIVILALLLSVLAVYKRVIGDNPMKPVWSASQVTYQEIENIIKDNTLNPDEIVLVNNAPGYYVATGRSAISIPNGDLMTTLDVSRKFNVSYLILESNHPGGLNDLYENPGDRPGLKFLESIAGTHIFRFEE